MIESFNVSTVRLSCYNEHKALRMFSLSNLKGSHEHVKAQKKYLFSRERSTSKAGQRLIPKTFTPVFLPRAGWHSWT